MTDANEGFDGWIGSGRRISLGAKAKGKQKKQREKYFPHGLTLFLEGSFVQLVNAVFIFVDIYKNGWYRCLCSGRVRRAYLVIRRAL